MKVIQADMYGPSDPKEMVRDTDKHSVDVVYCLEDQVDEGVLNIIKVNGNVVIISDPGIEDEKKEHLYMLTLAEKGSSDKSAMVMLRDRAILVGPHYARMKLQQMRNLRNNKLRRSLYF